MEDLIYLVFFLIIVFITYNYLYKGVRKSRKILINNKMNHDYSYFIPDILRKDTMNADPGNSNLYFTGDDEDTPYRAWSTVDVASVPSFYRSDFKTDMLGMKNFYDNSNDFHTKPVKPGTKSNKILRNASKNRPKRYPNVNCTYTKDNVNQCDFMGSYRKAPYSLNNINNNGKSVFQPIKSVSVENVNGEDYYSSKYKADPPMNGGNIFQNKNGYNVVGSSSVNEMPANVIQEQLL